MIRDTAELAVTFGGRRIDVDFPKMSGAVLDVIERFAHLAA